MGKEGLTMLGRSAGNAVTHSIAQQGPGELLPSCLCFAVRQPHRFDDASRCDRAAFPRRVRARPPLESQEIHQRSKAPVQCQAQALRPVRGRKTDTPGRSTAQPSIAPIFPDEQTQVDSQAPLTTLPRNEGFGQVSLHRRAWIAITQFPDRVWAPYTDPWNALHPASNA